MWLAAGCGVVLAMLAALLLGLPTLRLRADYFAITTIAFSEILRYVATNEDRLTGGSQGTINRGIGQATSVRRRWKSSSARWSEISTSAATLPCWSWSGPLPCSRSQWCT